MESEASHGGLESRLFGSKFFGTIMGFSSLIVMIGMTLGQLSVASFTTITATTVSFHNYGFCFSRRALCFWLCESPQQSALK